MTTRILLVSGSIRGRSTHTAALAPGGRAEGAQAEPATVLGYVGAAVVDVACRRAYVAHDSVGADGEVVEPEAVAGIAEVLRLHRTGGHRGCRRARPAPGGGRGDGIGGLGLGEPFRGGAVVRIPPNPSRTACPGTRADR